MFGVAQEDALTVGEQMQARTARQQIGHTMPEFVAQQRNHFANPLQTEPAAAQIAEDGKFGKILGGVKATMPLAGRHHNSLLIPPLQLPWCKAGTLGNLAGCEGLFHTCAKPDGRKSIARNKELRFV